MCRGNDSEGIEEYLEQELAEVLSWISAFFFVFISYRQLKEQPRSLLEIIEDRLIIKRYFNNI